jgi:hypothetical protein
MIDTNKLIEHAREMDRILNKAIEIHPGSPIHEKLHHILNTEAGPSELDIQIKQIKAINRRSILAIIISIVSFLYYLLF